MNLRRYFTRIRLFYVLILLLALALGYAWGMAATQFRLFPYNKIQKAYKTVENWFLSTQQKTILSTNLVPIEKKYFASEPSLGLEGWGGGLTQFGEHLLGVDKWGKLFLYTGNGEVHTLNIALDLNLDDFLTFMENRKDKNRVLKRTFRVYDVLASFDENWVNLFVTHTFWNANDSCVEFRISRLNKLDIKTLLENTFNIGPDEWEVIYKGNPCLHLRTIGGFGGLRSGGRMAFNSLGHLVVSVGDFEYDGFNSKEMFSQDDNVSYGKIISIDLESLDTRVIAKGIRNPQGLYIDASDNIWETEHGPRGGDELNLIKPGRNYGWPFVIYGTDYDLHQWPLSKQQGRHEDYERPIYAWTPSIAVSNLIQIRNVPKQWDGDFLVSSLRAETILRLRIREGRVILAEPIKTNSRIRDLEQMQDGTIVLWTDQASFVELHVAEIDDVAAKTQLSTAERWFGLEGVIASCKECHSFAPGFGNQNGPGLWNVYNRRIAATDYENYSRALKSIGGAWDEQSLTAYLVNPQKFAPGTSMPNPGIEDLSVVDALVRYLKRLRPEQH